MTTVARCEPDVLASLLVGESLVMQRLRALVRRVGPAKIPVFVTGPTGAGKELVAHALHLSSGQRGSFVAFNVCAIADSMFEDAFFGHARGAFTGAVSDSRGYLAEGDKGTVFLDEISGLPLMAQAKLLRAIETQTFRPVGGCRDRQSDFRVVAASNENLSTLCELGRFRLDLFHRLAGITLRVPSLAEHREDIPLLVDTFLGRGKQNPKAIDGQAIDVLMRQDWPGNVRQLKHVVELAAAFSDKDVIVRDAIQAALAADVAPPIGRLRDSEQARELLVVMEELHGDVALAAARLGVHRATIYRRLARLEVQQLGR